MLDAQSDGDATGAVAGRLDERGLGAVISEGELGVAASEGQRVVVAHAAEEKVCSRKGADDLVDEGPISKTAPQTEDGSQDVFLLDTGKALGESGRIRDDEVAGG